MAQQIKIGTEYMARLPGEPILVCVTVVERRGKRFIATRGKRRVVLTADAFITTAGPAWPNGPFGRLS